MKVNRYFILGIFLAMGILSSLSNIPNDGFASIASAILFTLLSYLSFKKSKTYVKKVKKKPINVPPVKETPKYQTDDYYEFIQKPLLKKHLFDTAQILMNTTNPSTFFSRLDFFELRLSELDKPALDTFLAKRNEIVALFIDRYYEKTKEEIANLKKLLPKEKKAQLFLLDVIKEYELSDENFEKISFYESKLVESIHVKEEATSKSFYIRNTNDYSYAINKNEESFLTSFTSTLSPEDMDDITYERMSDGTIAVYYSRMPLGKVRLQKRKHSMQILGDYNSDLVYGELDNFIELLPEWINYLEYLKSDRQNI